MNPARVLTIGFAGLVATGAMLLMLPAAAAPGANISWLDALFTAASAVCLTGLTVVSTAGDWSPVGQVIILVLVQIGGIGIMTMTTMLAALLGKRITLRDRLLLQQALSEFDLSGLVRLAVYVIFMSLAWEMVGAFLLTIRFAVEFPVIEALRLGVFHAVSAFNNAGFDLFGTGLLRFKRDPLVLGVVAVLAVVGGLGFSVLVDLRQWRAGHRLSLHSRVVLWATACLLAGGTVLVLMFEYANPHTFGGFGFGGKLLNAFFLVTARTAGFSAVDPAALTAPALLVMMLLMFIGGAPASTAGGIKTTTFTAVVATVLAALRGQPEATLFERRLSHELTGRALAVALVSLAAVTVVTMALLALETGDFLELAFEAVSAFANVGLSAGITPELSTGGRLLLIAAMCAGRLGPFTLAYALAKRQRRSTRVRYAEGRLIIG